MGSFSLNHTVIHRLWLASILCLPVAYAAVYWHWLTHFEASLEVTAPVMPAPAPQPQNIELDRLGTLFGITPQAAPKVEAIKESSLSLKLIASYVAGTDKNSAAVLSVNGQRQRLYFIGEEIMPEVELTAVEPKRILIKRSKGLEQITLRGKTDALLSAQAAVIDDGINRATAAQEHERNTIVENNQGLLNKLRELRTALDKAD